MNIGPASLSSLLTTPSASESAREERLTAAAENKLREARVAVETLKARGGQASEERKAIARQKIERLKAQLRFLQSMAGSDPKGAARLAAQLARELGAAVKDYAATGGSAVGLGAASALSAPGAAAGGGEAAAHAASPGASAEGGSAMVEAEGDVVAEGREDDASVKPANPYQQAVDEAQARAAEMARRGGERQADASFVADARQLAAQIKQLVRQAAEPKPGDDDALSPEEAREMEAAVAEMTRTVEQAGSDLSGGGVSLLV